MYSLSLRRAEETRQYSVMPRLEGGWEITTGQNHVPIGHVFCSDWHRVERKLALLDRTVEELLSEGWQIQSMNR